MMLRAHSSRLSYLKNALANESSRFPRAFGACQLFRYRNTLATKGKNTRSNKKSEPPKNNMVMNSKASAGSNKKKTVNFQPMDLHDSPYSRYFYEACQKTFESSIGDGKEFKLNDLKISSPGSDQRNQLIHKSILQALEAIKVVAMKNSSDIHSLVKPSISSLNMNVNEALEEYKRDLLNTDLHYTDYDNDLERFFLYVDNPPLVPVLGRIYAVLENAEFDSNNDLLRKTLKLICGSFLRFCRAQLRVSSFRETPSINMTNPAEWYPAARKIQRKVILHIGPTNSGKTYNALKAFENAKSGYYAGPLRLLAREIYSRMKAKGVKCNLVTGEEVIHDYDEFGIPVKLSSGTVEMVDIANDMDVAVIDEIQMLENNARGWAWTQAFLGLRAKEIHLCGDPSSEKIVRELVRMSGDKLHVKRYKRLSPLVVEDKPLWGEVSNIREGDCLIAFSKNDLLDWKAEIEKTHRNSKCAIIYGALPPESRSKQATYFNDHQCKYLVASDAVGMGLNLSIKRIIFLTLSKFDGQRVSRVSISDIKQIAGRAGRFQVAPSTSSNISNNTTENSAGGFVTAMNSKDLDIIRESMETPTPEINKSGLFPSDNLFKFYAQTFTKTRSFDRIIESMEVTTELNRSSFLCGVENMTEIASLFGHINGLSLNERMTLSRAPVKTRIPLAVMAFQGFCKTIANMESMTILDLHDDAFELLAVPDDYKFKVTDIAEYERLHSVIILYLWLSYRFPLNFRDREGAVELKVLCEEKIDLALRNTRRVRLAKWKKKVNRGSRR